MSIDLVGMSYWRDDGSYEGRALEVWVGDWVFTISYGRLE